MTVSSITSDPDDMTPPLCWDDVALTTVALEKCNMAVLKHVLGCLGIVTPTLKDWVLLHHITLGPVATLVPGRNPTSLCCRFFRTDPCPFDPQISSCCCHLKKHLLFRCLRIAMFLPRLGPLLARVTCPCSLLHCSIGL